MSTKRNVIIRRLDATLDFGETTYLVLNSQFIRSSITVNTIFRVYLSAPAEINSLAI